MGQYSVFGAPKLLSFCTRPHVNVLRVRKHKTCRTFKSTTPIAERNTYDRLHGDCMAVDNTTQSIRQSLRRYMAHSSMTKTSPISVTPQSGSRVAHFDFLFSTILNNFLDGATRQIQGKGQAMSEEMASICANIACSPADCCALIQVALKSIPFSIKEAFGRPPWSWQLVGNMKDATHKTLSLATGVYAYHLTNINKQDEQNFYVGQTTSSFASRWAAHARHRTAAKRVKKSSSRFYTNLKMTRPKDINIFILADISNFQEDDVVHKVMAGILEAGFCVFFDSLRHKPSPGSREIPGSKDSISFAHRCRPSSMPAVPWPGMNFAFPLFQDMLPRPWLEEEMHILSRIEESQECPVLSQEELAKAGFKRSLTAILSKRMSVDLRSVTLVRSA